MAKNYSCIYLSEKDAFFWEIPNKNGNGYRLKKIKTDVLLEEIRDIWRLADTWDKKIMVCIMGLGILISSMSAVTIFFYLIYGFCFL